MKLFILLKILILFFILNCQNHNFQETHPLAEKGVMDLRKWDFNSSNYSDSDSIVDLEGEWEFFWKEFCISESNCQSDNKNFITLPGNWNNFLIDGVPINGYGYATYRLKILLPNESDTSKREYSLRLRNILTNYKLFANGKFVVEVGKVNTDEKSSIPKFSPQVVELPEDLTGEIDLTIYISNFTHRKAGIWEAIQFGRKKDIFSLREKSLSMDLFLSGSLLIMGFYHFGLYLLRKKDSSSLYFGFFCLLFSLRTLVTEEGYFFTLFPNISYNWELTLEYLTITITIPFFALYLKNIFPEDAHKIPLVILASISMILTCIVILFPPQIFTYVVLVLEYLIIYGIIYTIILMILAVKRGRRGAKTFLIGFLVFGFFNINDILHNNHIVQTGFYGPLGLFWFIFSQAYFLSVRFSRAFVQVEELSENLEKQNKVLALQKDELQVKNFKLEQLTSEISATNTAYQKFVPSQFIQLLNKNHITNLELGDHIEKEMSVLFSDIRSFTTLSESLSPEDNFNFINSYLSRIGPKIRDYDGFIDKYIGDAIMALFDKTPDYALDAGIAMLDELHLMNQHRKSKNRKPLSIGVGIHTGKLTLGIVGEAGRMEGTVIADAVNLASRLEGLTKMYGASLLISEYMLSNIKNKEKYYYRKVDTVKVKGKNTAVGIIEVLNGNSERIIDLKLKTKELFEKGVIQFTEQNFEIAIETFTKVLEIDPLDRACKIHLERCHYYAKHGVPPDWEGVVALNNK
jgi:adenylate cyclase